MVFYERHSIGSTIRTLLAALLTVMSASMTPRPTFAGGDLLADSTAELNAASTSMGAPAGKVGTQVLRLRVDPDNFNLARPDWAGVAGGSRLGAVEGRVRIASGAREARSATQSENCSGRL
jgi:hypothetical protein